MPTLSQEIVIRENIEVEKQEKLKSLLEVTLTEEGIFMETGEEGTQDTEDMYIFIPENLELQDIGDTFHK